MPEIALAAEVRSEHGSGAARRLRHEGRIPGVLYGHGVEPLAFSVNARELRSALSSDSGANALINLQLGSTSHLAIARELQRHPVRRTLSHIDFQVVRRDEVVSAEVPIHLVGEANAVVKNGGNVEHLITSIHVRARPGDIPTVIEIDISPLEFGTSIRVGELIAPAGVTIEGDPETPVVVGHAPRVQTDEEAAAEGALAGAGEPAEAGSSGAGAEAAGDAAEASSEN